MECFMFLLGGRGGIIALSIAVMSATINMKDSRVISIDIGCQIISVTVLLQSF